MQQNTIDSRGRELFSELEYEQTVERRLVHREAVTEVFLTDSVELGDNEFLVGAMLPRSHVLFSDGDRRDHYDPLLLMEIVRQAAEYTAHRHHGVPIGRAFVIRDTSFEIHDHDGLKVGPSPGRAVVHVKTRYRERKEGKFPAIIIPFFDEIYVDGRSVARGKGRCLLLPTDLYDSVRDQSKRKKNEDANGGGPVLQSPLEPAVVGRAHPRNVVLADAAVQCDSDMTFSVLADTSHAVFFDHETDHVPGMLVVEAACQATMATLSTLRGIDPADVRIVSGKFDFTSFAELDRRVHCTSEILGDTDDLELVITFRQDDVEVGGVRFRVEVQR